MAEAMEAQEEAGAPPTAEAMEAQEEAGAPPTAEAMEAQEEEGAEEEDSVAPVGAKKCR